MLDKTSSGRAKRIHPLFNNPVSAELGARLSPNFPSSLQKTSAVSNFDSSIGGSRVYLPQIFWLETREDGKLKSFRDIQSVFGFSKSSILPPRIALPNVLGVQFNQKNPNKISYTIGTSAHIERQFIRDRLITISGRTGVDNIWDPTAGKYVDPVEYFDLIRDTIECLHAVGSPPVSSRGIHSENASKGQTPKGWRLVLRSTFEQYNMMVEPVQISYKRGGTSKFSFEYTITFRAYSKFEGKVDLNDLSFPKLNVFEASKALFKGGRNLALGVRNAIVREVPKRYEALAAHAIFSTLGTMHRIARPEDIPYHGLSSIAKTYWDALTKQQNQFDSFYDSLSWTEQQDWKEKNGERIDTARKAISVLRISTMMMVLSGDEPQAIKKFPSYITEDFVPAPDGVGPGVTVSTTLYDGPTKNVIALEGDTLESIAVREGLVIDWQSLALLNKMKSPYKFLDGSNLSAGDVVKVPSRGQKIESFDPNNAFGTDLLLGPDGDLVALNSDKDDVQLVVGAESLRQGLTHRLLVNAGDSMVFPSFGLESSPGNPMNFVTMTVGVADIVDQIQSDPRINSCNITQAVDGGDVMLVSCVAVAKDGQETHITAPVSI